MNYELGIMSGAPLWLELSGLPALVRARSKSAAGWAVFRKIVEFDCAQHPSTPGVVEVSVAQLAARSGVEPAEVGKVIPALRKLRLLKCFLPESDDEEALFEVICPLPVEMDRTDLVAAVLRESGQSPAFLRYLDDAVSDNDAVDPALQEVADLYLNVIGTKINVFVVDELRLMVRKYPLAAIRKTFNRARLNEVRSMRWIAGQLSRTGRKKVAKEEDSVKSESEEGVVDDRFVF